MKKIVVILIIFLSSCYRYPGYKCPDDVYYSPSIIRDQRIIYAPWAYSPLVPYYYYPNYGYRYYTPPRVNIHTPIPTLPPQPRRIITSSDNKKSEQNNNKSNAPIRKFN